MIKDDLQDYTQQAHTLLRAYGDAWMLQSDDCIGDVTYWIMHADNTYNPDKGAKPGTWRVTIAKFRIKHLRWQRWRTRQRHVCFTDITNEDKGFFDFLYSQASISAPSTFSDIADEMLDVIISRSKLSERQRLIVGKLRTGLTQSEIAAEFKVSKQAISCSMQLILKKFRSFVENMDRSDLPGFLI